VWWSMTSRRTLHICLLLPTASQRLSVKCERSPLPSELACRPWFRYRCGTLVVRARAKSLHGRLHVEDAS
jgi:hypothetical protein